MVSVFRFMRGIDKDIVKIYNNKYIEEFLQSSVNIGLERRWRVGQSKRHHSEFETPISCLESSFPFIAFLDMNQVIGSLKIQLSEDFGLT